MTPTETFPEQDTMEFNAILQEYERPFDEEEVSQPDGVRPQASSDHTKSGTGSDQLPLHQVENPHTNADPIVTAKFSNTTPPSTMCLVPEGGVPVNLWNLRSLEDEIAEL